MEIRNLLCLLVSFSSFKEIFCDLVYHNHNILTSVPEDIPSSTTEIWLYGNAIRTIRRRDFNDKYSDLEDLTVRYNKIKSIESGCFKGTVLRSLDLDSNELTCVPDLREISGTLEVLNLRFNQITKISMTELNYLTKLNELSLSVNLISTIMDFTLFMPELQDFELQGNPLDCCHGTAWLKQVSTGILYVGTFPCNYPSKWNSTAWIDITYDMILKQLCDVAKNAIVQDWKGRYLCLPKDQGIHILCVNETWLKGTETDSPVISELLPGGYLIRHVPRMSRLGGIAIIHHSLIDVHAPSSSLNFATFEHQECLVKVRQCMRLAVVYSPPNTKSCTMNPFFNEFADFLESFSSQKGHVLITGITDLHAYGLTGNELPCKGWQAGSGYVCHRLRQNPSED
ncbi:hypothetical protein CAPTEDRAFT_192185 [Capitella teleta]|uniref:Uncharacterized protein n=1 Tax=Capitella teleta TaxID=283909 RepID=R7TN14_CAPTE|nr:hypothetical protein CAPTEDRAFT_192185 [Capitella teleta]|eukprot:ELT94907.1 hypothetical protein CAPTEDRAFT_192185 [Capitella teleta]